MAKKMTGSELLIENVKRPKGARVKSVNIFEQAVALEKKNTRAKMAKAQSLKSGEASDAQVLSVAPLSSSRAMVLDTDEVSQNSQEFFIFLQEIVFRCVSFLKRNTMDIFFLFAALIATIVGGSYILDYTKSKSAQNQATVTVASAPQAKQNTTVVASNDKTALPLKMEREMSYSAFFLDGKTTLGPAARKKAAEIASGVSKQDVVDLYGYAGINRAKDKDFQVSIARQRAVSMKLALGDLGVNPQSITVIDPQTYLFTQELPEDPKMVTAKVRAGAEKQASNF